MEQTDDEYLYYIIIKTYSVPVGANYYHRFLQKITVYMQKK
jgi:hypothetical protein